MQKIDSFSSGGEDECLAVIAFALTKRNRKHRMWVRDLLKARSDDSNYNLVKEMAIGDKEMYFRYMRMTPGRMEHLFNLVAPRITKLSTNLRQPISPQQRLSLSLRHFATGESHISLSVQYRIGRQTVSKIIPETYKAIYDVLNPTYVNMPTSSDKWLAVSKQFEVKWNLPHVIVAIDGSISGCEAQIILAVCITITKDFSAWCFSPSVMQTTVFRCLTLASTGATMIGEC